MNKQTNIVPRLFVQNEDEISTKISLLLTTATDKFLTRFTGGCGFMSNEDALGMNEVLLSSFSTYKGSILFGGTRMIMKDTSKIKASITEIPYLIKELSPETILLGVVPKTDTLLFTDQGIVVSKDDKYSTIIHPCQDIALVIQKNVDENSKWDIEWKACHQIMADLDQFASIPNLTVVYNGGETTKNEIEIAAKKGFNILLINGSGRTADLFANNKTFLRSYKNVFVCDNTVSSLTSALISFGAIKPQFNVIRNSQNKHA